MNINIGLYNPKGLSMTNLIGIKSNVIIFCNGNNSCNNINININGNNK